MSRSRNSNSSRNSGGPKGSFNPNRNRNSNRNGGGRRGGGGFGGGRGRSFSRRKISTFNPSMLINKAPVATEKVEYQAKHTFADFDVSDQVKQNIINKGYKTPTPIQDQVIPYIMENKDVIGLASTGTGKTAAFLIPLIDKAVKNPNENVLILAPTRELALQIETEFKTFAQNTQVYSSLCIGGASMFRQIDSLKRNPQFVIGTPGRILDLEKRNKLKFTNFTSIVLDEVDQMLDMGFIGDIKYVVSRLPQKRHSLFFSATLPPKLSDVVHDFLHNPIKVQIQSQKASDTINQDIVKINGQSKINILHDLLIQEGFDKVLIFGRTKRGLDKLSNILYERGFQVAAIHGNKSQGQRQRSLRKFRENKVQVLLATDIASRGLDIDDVTHVINFDLPQTYEDYIHRIGRTGRANKSGIALSFVD